jgi:hypothetical protein
LVLPMPNSDATPAFVPMAAAAVLPGPSGRASSPIVLLSKARSLLLKATAVYAFAIAISMLPRHASDPPGAAGVPPVSVAWMSRISPSRSTTAHHILVPGVLRSGDGVVAAVF